jgi:hypothetical protein
MPIKPEDELRARTTSVPIIVLLHPGGEVQVDADMSEVPIS